MSNEKEIRVYPFNNLDKKEIINNLLEKSFLDIGHVNNVSDLNVKRDLYQFAGSVLHRAIELNDYEPKAEHPQPIIRDALIDVLDSSKGNYECMWKHDFDVINNQDDWKWLLIRNYSESLNAPCKLDWAINTFATDLSDYVLSSELPYFNGLKISYDKWQEHTLNLIKNAKPHQRVFNDEGGMDND